MDLNKTHKLSIYNKTNIKKSDKCGCFYCFNTFPPNEIKEWIDKGLTALCPKCGIDAVLPGSQVSLDEKFLKEMGKRWFSTNSGDEQWDTQD